LYYNNILCVNVLATRLSEVSIQISFDTLTEGVCQGNYVNIEINVSIRFVNICLFVIQQEIS